MKRDGGPKSYREPLKKPQYAITAESPAAGFAQWLFRRQLEPRTLDTDARVPTVVCYVALPDFTDRPEH
ncbi:MAG: hypothetical protein WAN46_08070 [Gammaproteobacteria bacterium]